MIVAKLRNFHNGILGGNYIEYGDASGEEYFETIFNNLFKEAMDNSNHIIINGTGTYGVPFTFIRTVLELTIETYGVSNVEKVYRGYYNTKMNYHTDKINIILEETIKFYKNQKVGFKHPDNLKYCKRYNLDKNTKTYE